MFTTNLQLRSNLFFVKLFTNRKMYGIIYGANKISAVLGVDKLHPIKVYCFCGIFTSLSIEKLFQCKAHRNKQSDGVVTYVELLVRSNDAMDDF